MLPTRVSVTFGYRLQTLRAASGGSTTNSSSAQTTTANKTIKYAYEQEFGSYNNNTADQNASKNAVVLNEVLRIGAVRHEGA